MSPQSVGSWLLLPSVKHLLRRPGWAAFHPGLAHRFPELPIGGALLAFGLALFGAGLGPGLLGTLAVALLAGEVLWQPAAPLALLGLTATAAAGVLTLGPNHAPDPAFLGLVFSAAIALPLKRRRRDGVVLTHLLYLALAGVQVAAALAAGQAVPWYRLAIEALGLNAAAAISFEINQSRRRAEQGRREAEALRAELAQRAEGAEALHRVAAQIAGRREVGKLTAETLAALQHLYGADAATFYLVDAQGQAHAVVARGIEPSLVKHLHLAYAGGRRGQALRLGQTEIIVAGPGERRAALRTLMAEKGLAQLAAVPAVRGGCLTAVLALYHREVRSYRPHERELLETFAEQLAGAVDLAQAYAALAEADRQREEFLAFVSHELRLPVASIAALAAALTGAPGLGPDDRRALEALGAEARALSRLAEDVLAIARLENGLLPMRFARIDLADLVARLVRQASQPERIAVSLPDQPVPVQADPERLGQAINNLISNALKYSPPDSRVEIAVGSSMAEAWVEVRDQGMGFEPSEAARLFQKYARLRNEQTARVPGVGLGLYLVRLLVEAHGGRVEACSPGPGLGASFSLRLPRRRETDPGEGSSGD